MATVQNHIKELLFEQDCVVIPDFGGFITNFDAAKIDLSNQTLLPPRKWLAFNGLLKNDDGLLSNYIAHNEGISREDAVQRIRVFVEDAKKIIRYDQKYHIEEVGTFSQNEEGKIQFHPTEFSNFYAESFGLEAVRLLKPLKSEVKKEIKTTSTHTIQQVFSANDRKKIAAEVIQEYPMLKNAIPRKRNQLLKFLVSMVGASLLVSFIYMYENPNLSLSTFNPFQLSQEQSTISKEELYSEIHTNNKVIEQPKSTTAEIHTENIVKPTNSTVETNPQEERFMVIVGSFGLRENAENQLKELEKNGFVASKIIEPASGAKLLKVSAGGFNSEEAALEASTKISKQLHRNTWIYKL